MTWKKNILVIVGSAGSNSANLKLAEQIAILVKNEFRVTLYTSLKLLPHFDPELSSGNPPLEIVEFRNAIEGSDGIIICSPEYIFSMPSGLKNAIEWCISTTVLSNKPCGLITASANGEKGHEELQLIMKTANSKFTDETTLLIQGIKGKFDLNGKLIDNDAIKKLNSFIAAFSNLVINHKPG